jgi:hypothetical protein
LTWDLVDRRKQYGTWLSFCNKYLTWLYSHHCVVVVDGAVDIGEDLGCFCLKGRDVEMG